MSLVSAAALAVFACGPLPNQNDAGTDGGNDACLAFPERIDANYTVERGCWLVLKTPVIAAGVTVTMKPGAKLVFSSGTGLTFTADQVLTAVGTADLPILLTAATPTRGFWKGLRFDGTANVSTLEYVTVEFGGDTQADADAANVKLVADSRGARLAMSHCTVRESEGWGLWFTGSAVVPTFVANVLTANTLGPASLDAQTVGRVDATSTFTGNGKDEVEVRGNRLVADATWSAIGVPYHLAGDLAALATSTLTLQPGVKLIFPPEAAFTFSGDAAALVAVGTAAAPIVFTGETASRGAWEGVVFDGSHNTLNHLSYVTIEYAGNTSSDAKAAALLLKADSHGVQVGIDHVTLRESQGFGLRLYGTAVVPAFDGNVLTANALGPALVDAKAVFQLSPGSTFTGNDLDRVTVEGSYVSGDVAWRTLDVPYRFLGTNLSPQGVWTLAAGLVLEMGPMSRIDVGGGDFVGFHAAGTATAPVTITGVAKTNGSWDGIDFDTTLNASNILDHAVVEYGGGGMRFGWKAMINSHSDSHGVQVAVTNSTVRHSALWGIYFTKFQAGAVSGNTYADNALGDYFHDP